MFQLNNREIAILVWIVVFIVWALTQRNIRHAFGNVARAFLNLKIQSSVLMMTLYVMGCIFFLSELGIWHWVNLKTTLVWGVTFALVTMFDVNRITEDKTFFRRTIRDIFSATAIILFVAEFYAFSLLTEIILVPTLALLTALHAYSGTDKQYATARKLMDWVIAICGFGIIGFGTFQTIAQFKDFATIESAREFAVPILLSVVFIPFIWALNIIVSYEMAFARLRIGLKDRDIQTFAKWRSVFAFMFDLDLLRRWVRQVNTFCPSTKEEVIKSIRNIKELKWREKNPPSVSPAEGWSPYLAKEFMTSKGLVTGDYHQSFDGFYASSPYLEVGEGLMRDNIAYYVDGTEYIAKQLKLVLNVNNPKYPQESEEKFSFFADELLKASLQGEYDPHLSRQLISADNSTIDTAIASIKLAKEVWSGGIKGGYTRSLTIERGVHTEQQEKLVL